MADVAGFLDASGKTLHFLPRYHTVRQQVLQKIFSTHLDLFNFKFEQLIFQFRIIRLGTSA